MMARVLVIFGTTYGQTANVALAVEGRLRFRGHHVAVADAALAQPSPADFDAVVVAASVHAGRYQPEIVEWVTAHVTALNRMPTAFVSVCLGVVWHKPRIDRELQAVMDAFLKTTGWCPATRGMVAGAVHYTRYNAVVRWFMHQVMRRKAPDAALDYEFTNWELLGRLADRFNTTIHECPPAVA
jgi:menaquinone-dependent protoporphyrinogen oxidase